MRLIFNMIKQQKITFYLTVTLYLIINLANGSQETCPSTCECFGTIVDCSNNGLSQVPENLPSWVDHLNLNKNPRMVFGTDSLADLQNLRILSIANLQLEDVPDLGFLPTLELIDLSGNKISDASAAWEDTFPNVHSLNLIKNQFHLLDFTQFHPLPIRKIDFKSNSISTISDQSTPSLKSLVDLRLARNQINDQAFRNLSVLFTHMTNLKQLDLTRNLIEKPEGLMFQNLTNLTVLKLKRNKIIDLPPGVFYGLKSLTTLRLDNNTNITEISNGWLFDQENLKVLSLSHNNIGKIIDTAWEATKKLSVLDLNWNHLGCSHSEPSFKGLKSLVELHLAHNCFSNIDETTFGELLRLRKLDLSYNQLQLSVEYSTGAFASLKSLVTLNLSYNKIETIHGHVFKPLGALQNLDLAGNNIKTLPQNPFKGLSRLRHLSFNSSSLVCDCGLDWMPEFIKLRAFTDSKFTCGFPESLRGRPVVKLKKRQLSCDQSPTPVLTETPANQTLLYGKNATLRCEAQSSSHDDPAFTWMKNRHVVEPFHVRTFMRVRDDESTHVVSEFHIANVTHAHAGVYQCIARNDFGPRYSPPATIKVHRMPFFTMRPLSSEVRVGAVAQIRCAAEGFPTPEILVNKIGDFTASREKRLYFSDSTYFIRPIEAEDDGVYVCTARNAAGAVNVTARVSVITTPSFARLPRNQVAALGQSIALECQGTGQPKPKVTWFKENQLVTPDANRILLQDGQFLVLLHVSKEDIGTYLCELTNRLGTKRKKLNLALKQELLFPAITGLMIMIAVISVVLTSFVWVIIIYNMRNRLKENSEGPSPPKPRKTYLDEPPQLLRSPDIHKEQVEQTNALLAPVFSSTPQDSGSEHSSGKDSGVGESHQRSTEDLHRHRKSLILYPDSPNGGITLKGQSMMSRGGLDEMRPRLSTFNHGSSSDSRSVNPTYASLRRGSTSRLLAVPSPVTPNGSGNNLYMQSLPRHIYRNRSKYSIPVTDSVTCSTASLSRRKPSISLSMGGPRSLRDEEEDLKPVSPLNSPLSGGDEPIKIAPNFYSFRADDNDPPPLPNGVHMLPSR